MGGGQMPADNTNAMGGTNEFVGRCFPGMGIWPRCRFWFPIAATKSSVANLQDSSEATEGKRTQGVRGLQGAHLRHLQGGDQQPQQPEQPEQPGMQPVVQPVMQPVMQPAMPMGVSNMGGGYMTGGNTNALGGSNEIVIDRCFRGSWNWPRCCFRGSPFWPRCRFGIGRPRPRCFPGSLDYPRCTRYSV
ncbi:hypothetical protein PC119_g11369 [Phytophthora cactorum]|nr:hypothetical protein PC119_g11369 [Phytophthora cactorum]